MRRITWILVFGLTAACSNSAQTYSSNAPPSSTTEPVTTTSTTAAGRPGAQGIGDTVFPALGNGGYDVSEYRINLVFDGELQEFDGVVEIDATALHPLSSLNLDIHEFDIGEVVVKSARVEVPAKFEVDGGELIVKICPTVSAGAPFTVKVQYQGTVGTLPIGQRSFSPGLQRAVSGAIYLIAEPDGARTVFPANDHPSDTATVRLAVTVPDGLAVASAGYQSDEPVDGGRRWVFAHTEPVATYRIPLAIGEFERTVEEFGGLPYVLYTQDGHRPEDLAPLAFQDEIVEFFASVFGPYPFKETGAIMVVDDFTGAMETQPLTTYTTGIMFLGDRVVAHELAHSWFGNWVGIRDWSDIWLNEGFATFAEWLWLEHRDGANAYRQRIESRYAAAQDGPLTAIDPGDVLASKAYVRGGLTLVALREQVGDEAFFGFVDAYLDEFGGGWTTTLGFLELVGQVLGAESRALMEEWVLGVEVPELGQ